MALVMALLLAFFIEVVLVMLPVPLVLFWLALPLPAFVGAFVGFIVSPLVDAPAVTLC